MNVNEFIAKSRTATLRVRLSELSPARWSHLSTEVGADLSLNDTTEKSTPNDQGVTMWSRMLDSSSEASGMGAVPALIAWDWVLIGSGVIARCNVQQVATNIELIGEDEQPIQSAMRPLVFATLIHGLPWQAEVLREIDAHGST